MPWLEQPSASSSSGGLGPSAFDKETLQGVEALSVEVPRGLRVYGSPRIAGALRGRVEVRVPTRTYNVTVEPKARTPKPKELYRELQRPRTEIELDVQRAKAGDQHVNTFVDKRFIFRQERLKRFQVGSHFPALVSPRLVPSWQTSETAAKNTEQESPQQQASRRASASGRRSPSPTLTRLTASRAQKQTRKMPTALTSPWLVSGAAGASELICDRKNVLCNELYDDVGVGFDEGTRQVDKSLWQSATTMLPTSISEAKATCDSLQPYKQEHITAMRERGRVLNDSLRERYDILRDNFQNARAAMIERQGCLSGFGRSGQDKQANQATGKAGTPKKAIVDEDYNHSRAYR